MLGKVVNVMILPPSPMAKGEQNKRKPIHLGRIQNSARFISHETRSQNVYLIGLNRYAKRCNGKVIAMVQFEGQASFFPVVAPVKSFFYEPQLRHLLSSYEQKPVAQIQCLYEKSCGAVIFRKDPDKPRFLLIKNIKGKNWGFPKGHVELGESEEETALREVREETGLSIEILPGFRSVIQYSIWGKANKQVVFFLAKCGRSDDVHVQASEIEKYSWMTYEEALSTFRFDNDKKVLKNAVAWLRKNNPKP